MHYAVSSQFLACCFVLLSITQREHIFWFDEVQLAGFIFFWPNFSVSFQKFYSFDLFTHDSGLGLSSVWGEGQCPTSSPFTSSFCDTSRKDRISFLSPAELSRYLCGSERAIHVWVSFRRPSLFHWFQRLRPTQKTPPSRWLCPYKSQNQQMWVFSNFAHLFQNGLSYGRPSALLYQVLNQRINF